MWDMLAHVLLRANSPLHGFLREVEAILTGEVILTRGGRWGQAKEERERDRRNTVLFILRKNTGQGVGRMDFDTQL